MFSDYFTVLCRTSKPNPSQPYLGMSLLVVSKDDSVKVRRIKTSYSGSAGTAYVEFNESMVPVANMIGNEGEGFRYTMSNFNNERWGMIVGGNNPSNPNNPDSLDSPDSPDSPDNHVV